MKPVACPKHEEQHDERGLCAYCEIEKRLAERDSETRSVWDIMRAA